MSASDRPDTPWSGGPPRRRPRCRPLACCQPGGRHRRCLTASPSEPGGGPPSPAGRWRGRRVVGLLFPTRPARLLLAIFVANFSGVRVHGVVSLRRTVNWDRSPACRAWPPRLGRSPAYAEEPELFLSCHIASKPASPRDAPLQCLRHTAHDDAPTGASPAFPPLSVPADLTRTPAVRAVVIATETRAAALLADRNHCVVAVWLVAEIALGEFGHHSHDAAT